jgi:outer membrane receptor protein involved in Fe transport
MIRRVSRASRPWLFATASAAVFAAAEPALAQSDTGVSEVVVTGSRITATGFTAPSPITTISAANMEQLGLTNAGVALNQLPSFRADLTPNNNGFANFNLGAQIVNLRGLGAPRTLVLVDGHRFITSTREGTVDLNLIPSIMIERTEIVTGGASAAYGTDAISGAVNIILNTKLNGIKGQVDGGVTQRGDGKSFHAALAGGTDFMGGRGHIVIGGEYANDAKIGNCFTRDYCTTAGVALNGAGAAHDNSQPYNIVFAQNYGYLNVTTGGVIPNIAANPAALRNLQFAPNGALIPYNPGVYQGGGFSISPDNRSNLIDSNLAVPVNRWNIFSHADFDLTPSIKAFVEGSYAYISGINVGNQANDATIGIKRDNAFLNDQLKAFFAANPTVARITIGRLSEDMGKLTGESNAGTWRFAGGLKGDFNADWHWNVSADYGENLRHQNVYNNRIQDNFFGPETNTASVNYRAGGAVDAVVNPANGQIVCRSTIDRNDPQYNPNNGCVPVNLFGAGRPSAAAIGYSMGTNYTTLTFTQMDASAGVSGKLFHTWAGPIDVAAGVDYRKSSIDFRNDAIGDRFGWYYNYGASYAGTTKVTELYGEAQVPLLKDLPFAKSFDVNLAGRNTWYQNTNDKTGASKKTHVGSWKISLVYDMNDWMRIRFTRSRDIRQANFNELYSTSLSTFGGTVNPWTNQTDFATSLSGGNVSVRPEVGDTYTIGGVFRPQWSWLEGFRLSVDYYNIALTGAIGALSNTQLVSDCFTYGPTAESCQRITFQSGYGSTIVSINRTNQNLSRLKQSGVDIEAEYRTDVDRVLKGVPGDVAFHVLASWVEHQSSRQGSFFLDRAGMTGQFPGFGQIGTPGVPRWALNGTQTYNLGRLSLTLQERYVAKGILNASQIGPEDAGYSITNPISVSTNRVPSRLYFNLSGRFDVVKNEKNTVQVFGSISNLFDKAPPLAPGLISYSEPAFFDMIGRTFRGGIRFTH